MKPLAISNLGTVELSITPDAELRKTQALDVAGMVISVTDAATQQVAADAVTGIQSLLKTLEESRTEVKAPVLKLGKDIDAKAREYAKELESEKDRITRLIKGFQREEMERLEAERRREADLAAARQRKLDLERRELEALGQTEAAAEVAEKALEVAAPKPPAAPPKAHGVAARKVWKFEVLDVRKLLSVRPDLVKVEASAIDINRAISGGMRECEGLRIYEDIATAVRA